MEAKFSIPFTCAAAFARGQVTRGEFCRDLLEDPQVRRVAQATKVVSSEDFTRRYPQRWGSRMTVTLENGETLSCQVDAMSGSVAVPLSPERERDKFFDLTVPALGRRRAEALMDGILRVETLERLPDLA